MSETVVSTNWLLDWILGRAWVPGGLYTRLQDIAEAWLIALTPAHFFARTKTVEGVHTALNETDMPK